MAYLQKEWDKSNKYNALLPGVLMPERLLKCFEEKY